VTAGKHTSDRIDLFPGAVLPEYEPTQELEDEAMKSPRDHQPPFPVRDYSLALQSAVSWLGDRYLLATPIHATNQRARSSFNRPRGRASL
jgi:hypothetical protein